MEHIDLIINNAPFAVGLFIPAVIEFLNKDVRTSKERFFVTILTCLVAATLLKWSDIIYGSPHELIVSLGIIFTESQVVYRTYFENSWLRWKISANMGVAAVPSNAIG